MDVSDRSCLVVGFLFGAFTAFGCTFALTWVDKIGDFLRRRKEKKHLLVATLRQMSVQIEELKTALSENSAQPNRKSQEKTAIHVEKHMNGKATEKRVQ